jgi:hypothetical protein
MGYQLRSNLGKDQNGEPLLPDTSPFQVEIAITKLKIYKSIDSDQIPK